MTLRQINNLLREDEIAGCEIPLVRLTAFIALLRSIDQQEIATNEGIEACIEMFKLNYGQVTTNSVDQFTNMNHVILDIEIDNDYILEVMGAD